MAEIIAFISHITFDYLIPVVMGIGFIAAVVSSVLCIHFNYYYFLIHGTILWEMTDDRPSEVARVKKLNSTKWSIGVADALLFTIVLVGVGLIASIMWPVTLIFLILFVLLSIQKVIFRERHRKLRFELKLKGLYHD